MINIKNKEFLETMAKQGLTQIELAKKAGLYQSYISMIINKKRSMRAPTAKKICEVLKCNFDDIFTFSERNETNAK